MAQLRSVAVLTLCALVGAGSSSIAAQTAASAPDWDSALSLPVAADFNPDPKIVEINLEAVSYTHLTLPTILRV